MPFASRRAQLKLTNKEVEAVTALSQSRSEPAGRVQRAAILLRYHAGETVSDRPEPWYEPTARRTMRGQSLGSGGDAGVI